MRRFSRPRAGTILAGLALFVALGGTAMAAATVVNIADPTTPSRVAHVDSAGKLEVGDGAGPLTVDGNVGETIPKAPFLGHAYLSQSGVNTLIDANKATVALTRLTVGNYFDQANAAPAEVRLYVQSGNATTCDGSTGSQSVGVYELQAGQTFSDGMASPIVLKPLVSGDVWCLLGSVNLRGTPGGYYLPEVSFSGFLASGTLPSGAVSAPAATGAVPQARRATR